MNHPQFIDWSAAREAMILEGQKQELSRRYVVAVSQLKASQTQLAKSAPELLSTLHRHHDAFRAMLQVNLTVLATEPTGKSPVTNAWTPDGRYAFITNNSDTFASVFDAKTYREIKRLEIGAGGANIGFSRDGSSAFISVAPANVVAVVDLSRLEVVEQVQTGSQPTGLIVL